MALATDTHPVSAVDPAEPLLVVDDLHTVFDLRQGEVRAVDGVSFALEGRDLLALDEEAMRDVRGKDLAMIFQEPMTSLNPVLTIGSQIAEFVLLHENVSRKEAWAK